MNTLRNIAKKAVAVGSGIVMLGATIGSALALDLAQYPAPFIQNGQFNGMIVVGAKAATSDVIGSNDIMASLQAAAVTPVQQGASTSTSTVYSGDAKQIQLSSDNLEIGVPLGSVIQSLTADDLALLKGGSINTNSGSTDYKQYLKLQTGPGAVDGSSGQVMYGRDEFDNVGDWLKFVDQQPMFIYQMDFQEGLESQVIDPNANTDPRQLRDINNENLFILGQYYNIVDTQLTANSSMGLTGFDDNSNSLTMRLIAGEVSDTLSQGDTKTYTVDGKQYEVTVLFVSNTANEVKFLVNGETTKSLAKGDTYKLADGMEIGIRDILTSQNANAKGATDITEFYLGANKVEFTEPDWTGASPGRGNAPTGFDGTLKVNNVNIDDGDVSIVGSVSSSNTFKISSIKYELDTNANAGDMYVAPGQGVRANLRHPEGMLNNVWDIKYAGLTAPGTTEIRTDSRGDNAYTLVFTNSGGAMYNVPLADNSGDTVSTGSAGDPNAFKWGDDHRDLIWTETGPVTNESAYSIDRNDYFIVNDQATKNGNTHVMQWTDVDTTQHTVSFTDYAGGTFQEIYTGDPTVVGSATGTLIVGGHSYMFYVFQDASENVFADTKFHLAVDLNGNAAIAAGQMSEIVTKGGGQLQLPEQDTGAEVYTADTDGGYFPVFDGAGANTDAFNVTLVTDSSLFNRQGIGDENLYWTISATGTDTANSQVDLTLPSQTLFTAASGSFLSNEPWFTDANYGSNKLFVETVPGGNLRKALDRFGTYLEVTTNTGSNNPNTIKIEFPFEQRLAQVWVVGNSQASTTTSSAGGTRVNPIPVGSAVLDTDVTADANNFIVVGGPCVNTLAASLLGNPADCTEGFTAGHAMLKLFNTGQHTALLVAGFAAQDTVGGSRVLAQYKDYNLTGDHADITLAGVTVVSIQ